MRSHAPVNRDRHDARVGATLSSRAFRRHPRGTALAAVFLLSVVGMGIGHGQALTVYGGPMKVIDNGDRATAWAVDYNERVAGPLEIGLLYLNEGHPNNHHRDGIAPELWLRSPRTTSGLSFAAGAGPFYYFDTTRDLTRDYSNDHGWGMIYSAAAQWQWHPRWFLSLRANHVRTYGSFDTNAVLLGVGYRWEAGLIDEEPIPGVTPTARNEINLLIGQTVVNSFASESSMATSVEYRRSLRRWADWTVSFLNEGDARLIRRNGAATQLWLVRRAHDDRVALSVGAGPYLAIDRRNPDTQRSGGERLAGLITFSARYSFTPHWHVRASWNRVLADYHRDTDVFLAGVGYGF